ncbi:hypothetical protein BDZ45DRAFT_801128 [Acephala macrosclerotiorum]|nr:hypothetical protein BDZ45DRAFT_801128 [Acephala macrosclerotiorum]
MSKAEVHEKALKGEAKSHTTSVSGATEPLKKEYDALEPLDGRENPKATFKFKCQSQHALKSLLILPRTPSPEPKLASSAATPSTATRLPVTDPNGPQTMKLRSRATVAEPIIRPFLVLVLHRPSSVRFFNRVWLIKEAEN